MAKFNKYFPFVILYFFFNTLFLPLGLLYTTILTPVFIWWLYRQDHFRNGSIFFLITVPFIVIHYLQGIDPYYYFRSYFLLFTAFVFLLTTIHFLEVTVSLRIIFRRLLLLNFIFVIFAVVLFFIPSYRHWMWAVSDISTGLTQFPRLRLFTYEPSYYSTLLIPLAFYYYLKIVLFRYSNGIVPFLLITIPLILSFSLGAIFGIAISFFLLFFTHIRTFFKEKKAAEYALFTIIVLLVLSITAYFVFPDNPFFFRIRNIFNGSDTSFNGRFFDSFYLAWKVAQEKSIFFWSWSRSN